MAGLWSTYDLQTHLYYASHDVQRHVGTRYGIRTILQRQNRELTQLREQRLGFKRRIAAQKAPFDSHGQEVFSNGKTFITRDVTATSGVFGKCLTDRVDVSEPTLLI